MWVYNNSAIQTLSAVQHQATGVEASTYAQDKLLDPIGMTQSEMKKDASGGTPTFMGLSSTCRDMARFGYPSQKLNAAYSYLWWLNRKGHIDSPTRATTGKEADDEIDGQMVPGAPDNMFWALGLGNQIISVDPGSDTVVVRLGPARAPAGATAFTQKDTAAVVTDALKK